MKLLRTFQTFLFPFCLALAPLAAATVATDANASVMIAVPFDSLVKDADAVAVILPQEAKSVWEDGRIYTYTRVKVEQGVAGETTGAGGAGGAGEVWIRTMGGVVGKIGQLVDGEPVFAVNKPNLVFLRKFKAGGTWEVSARAQGQYPVVFDEVRKAKRIMRSANVGVLLPPKRLQVDSDATAAGAVTPQGQTSTRQEAQAADVSKIRLAGDVLNDRPLDEASKEVASAWKRLHPQTAAGK